MSTNYGIITEILNLIDKLIIESNKKSYNTKELHSFKNNIYNVIRLQYKHVNKEIVNEICNRIFKVKYSINKKIDYDNGKNSFRELEDLYPDVDVPNEFKDIDLQFIKLKMLPQPEQRTSEWFEYRHNRLTASDTATALDLNPYEPVESFILKKCEPCAFKDNATVFHGKKYEIIANMIYEHIYNVRVFEFGALPSDKYKFLGASPDGICSKYTLDNKFSLKYGTMLEIKCPVTRVINTHGNIIGDICPYYYYCQIQQQLECCELDLCDFWQCKISEYKSRQQFINDDCDTCRISEGTNDELLIVHNKIKKGIILEFYPLNFKPDFDGDNIEWKSKYIVPKRLDLSIELYDTWVIKMMDEYKNLYPEIAKNYYFNKIIYWKLDLAHNVSIKRDIQFLNNIIPVLKNTWEQVLFYRKNRDKLNILRNIISKRTKYIKINTQYTIHNNVILTNKFKFLDDNFNLNIINNQIIKDDNKYNNDSESKKNINNYADAQFI